MAATLVVWRDDAAVERGGAAVGGVLAERVGVNFVFLVSGVLMLTPILFIRLITDDEPHVSRRHESFGLGNAMRIPNFVVVLCLVAIPAKFVLHGYVYYLAPLYLKDLGLSQGAVACNVMLYALFMAPAITLGNWLTRKNISSDSLMLGASIFTAVALALAGVETAIAIAMIGVIQGVASVPMLGKIPKIAAGDRNVQVALFAILRSGERVGSMLGLAFLRCPFLAPGIAAIKICGRLPGWSQPRCLIRFCPSQVPNGQASAA